MIYTLREPCSECPFLIGSGFTFQRLSEHASGEFACHKACKVDEETGDFVPRSEKTPHCAGALIFLMRQGKSHQMMRIVHRLGMFDPDNLDMRARVGAHVSDYRQQSRPLRPPHARRSK